MLTLSLYEAVFNSFPIGHYLLSPSADPVILAVNDAFLKTVARSREELVGKKLFSVFPENPSDPKDTGVTALRASLARVIETGKQDALPLQRYPITITAADGKEQYEERFWSAVNTPVMDANGQLQCISHSTTDVTEKARAEIALRKAQARYRSLTESIDEGFCVIEVIFNEQQQPIDYFFREINQVFELQTGLYDAVGKSMRALAPSHEEYWFATYGEVAKSGRPIRFESEAKALNRWYDVYAYRVDEPGQNMVGILFRDIAHRKQQEEALRTSEGRLRALINATADAVYRMSPGWTHMHYLEGRGFLKDSMDASNSWLNEYIPPEDQDTVRKAINTAIRNKTVFQLEHRVRRADGSYGWTYSRAVPMFGADGEIHEWVGAASDITGRKHAEEQLKASDQRKDEFLAMLAHELRNPLAPIAAAAELLSLARLDEEKVRQTSGIISRQVKHMTGLVEDLLDVSRVTRGLVNLQEARLDMKKVIADSVEQVRPLIEAREHRLTIHTQPKPAFVSGDQKRLVQVLSNLLNNAAKYTPEGGSIVLSMEVDGGYVKTTVSDNGIGMTDAMAGHAFELFAQAERTPDRAQGGLGIGLALVKSLVSLHGGSIAASSGGIGKGSAFTFSLPNLSGHIDIPQVDKHHTVHASQGSLLKVMIIDDNADAARMLAMLLEALGYQTIVEHSALKALALAKVEKPSVCLMDIGLPEMDGYELARRLRAQPETAKTVLVAVTGYGQERNSAVQAGFDHYFVKPVEAGKIVDLLSQVKGS